MQTNHLTKPFVKISPWFYIQLFSGLSKDKVVDTKSTVFLLSILRFSKAFLLNRNLCVFFPLEFLSRISNCTGVSVFKTGDYEMGKEQRRCVDG